VQRGRDLPTATARVGASRAKKRTSLLKKRTSLFKKRPSLLGLDVRITRGVLFSD